MTIEQLLAAARGVKGARRNEERRTFLGVGYTLWQGVAGPWWFAEIDGGGFGVGETLEDVVAMAEAHIQEESPCLSL